MLYRKGSGQEAKLCHIGHALTENRHGLILGVTVSVASGMAEPAAALEMLDRLQQRHGKKPKTLGADKGYDSGPFYQQLESRGVEPHCAMIRTPPPNPKYIVRRRQAEVEARCRMRGRLGSLEYCLSQRCRKKVEECFGWIKTIGGLARSRHAGRWRIRQQPEVLAAAYNLVRMRKRIPT